VSCKPVGSEFADWGSLIGVYLPAARANSRLQRRAARCRLDESLWDTWLLCMACLRGRARRRLRRGATPNGGPERRCAEQISAQRNVVVAVKNWLTARAQFAWIG